MASILNKKSNEEQMQEMAQAKTGAQGSTLAGSPQGQAKKPAASGGFTNLQSYLQANTGAGQQIAGRVKQDVGQKQEQAQQKVGEVASVRDRVAAEQDRIKSAAGLGSRIQEAAGTGNMLSEDEQKNIQYLRQGGYQDTAGQLAGQQLSAGAQAQSSLGNVAQRLGELSTEKGRHNILRDIYGRPSYTAGQQKLDQLFLQRSQGGQNDLRSMQQQTAQDYMAQQAALGKSQSETGNILQDMLKQASEGSTALTGALTGAQSQIEAAQEEEANKTNTQRQQEYDQAQAALQSGKMTPELAKMLGLDTYKGPTFNLVKDLQGEGGAGLAQSFLSRGKQVGAQDVVSEDEFKRYNQLQGLLGGTGKYAAAGDAGSGLAAAGGGKGGSAILGELQRRQEEANKKAAETSLTGKGVSKHHKDITASTGPIKVEDLLKGIDVSAIGHGSKKGNAGDWVPNLSGATGGIDPFAGMTESFAKEFSRQFDTGSVAEQKKGAAKWAAKRAKSDLEKKFKNYLQEQGYGESFTVGDQQQPIAIPSVNRLPGGK